jgi:hypothetical protein
VAKAIARCRDTYSGVPDLELPLIIDNDVIILGDEKLAAQMRRAGIIAICCPMSHWHSRYTAVLRGAAVRVYLGGAGGVEQELAAEIKAALADHHPKLKVYSNLPPRLWIMAGILVGESKKCLTNQQRKTKPR